MTTEPLAVVLARANEAAKRHLARNLDAHVCGLFCSNDVCPGRGHPSRQFLVDRSLARLERRKAQPQ